MICHMKRISQYVVLVLISALVMPTNAYASQDGSGIINVPPSSVPLPPGHEPPADQRATASAPEQPNVLDRIMRAYPDKIAIKKENRNDLSSCNAAEGEAMLIALHNCWPILNGFKIYYEAKKISRDHRLARQALVRENPRYRDSDDYKANQEAEYEDAIRSAKKVETLAGVREYPMQDMLLFLANIIQISVAQKRDDYDTALKHLDNSIMIFETTRITEPGFANLEILTNQRALMVERLEKHSK